MTEYGYCGEVAAKPGVTMRELAASIERVCGGAVSANGFPTTDILYRVRRKDGVRVVIDFMGFVASERRAPSHDVIERVILAVAPHVQDGQEMLVSPDCASVGPNGQSEGNMLYRFWKGRVQRAPAVLRPAGRWKPVTLNGRGT